MEPNTSDMKTVMVVHFDSGQSLLIDLDNPDFPTHEACKGFIDSKLMDNPVFYVNNVILITQKIEFIEFEKVSA